MAFLILLSDKPDTFYFEIGSLSDLMKTQPIRVHSYTLHFFMMHITNIYDHLSLLNGPVAILDYAFLSSVFCKLKADSQTLN